MAQYDDPRILRAIAHPTRNRVLHELSAAGSARAADIARRLGIPANQASFHLRQLAKYDLVEEDPGARRDRRDRVWRLVDPEGIRFDAADVLAQPGGKAAFTVFRRNAVEWGQHLVERALAQEEDGGSERSVAEWSVLLTSEEAEQLQQELTAVLERFREAGRAAGPEGRTTYSVFQLIQPYPGLPEAEGPEEPEGRG